MLDFRPFSSTDEMDEALISNWNERVGKNDMIYHLGDFSFLNKEKTAAILDRLSGQIHLIKGNHDKSLDRLASKFVSFQDYKVVKIEGQRIVLLHYAMRTWDMSHYGSFHLYGHCFDEETEVLTFDGWKSRKSIGIEDSIATIAYPNDVIVYQKPSEIVDVLYTGDQYELTGRNVNGIFTREHTMLIAEAKGSLSKIQVSNFLDQTNRRIPLNGTSGFNEYPIEDDTLRLYIWLVTDGSLCNFTLGRFHLVKERKIERLTQLLSRMGIQYSQNSSGSDHTTRINFTVPKKLLEFGIKPLNPFILELSQRQGSIVVEEYVNTDGNMSSNATRSFQISTGKPVEADLLQHFLITHGYSCNLSLRHRDLSAYGYGQYETHILSANSKRIWQTTRSYANMVTSYVQDKPFWCLRVPNQTLIIRRNGMVHITGNSHGNLPDDPGSLSMDVGVDPNELYPISFEEVKEKMSLKTFVPIDHHVPREERG